MNKPICLLIIIFFMATICYSQITPLTNITDIPNSDAFSGKTGVGYANGQVYLAYKSKSLHGDQIILAKSSEADHFSYSVIHTFTDIEDTTGTVSAAPTLWIDNEHIVIMFSRHSRLYKSESLNGGDSFQTIELEYAFDSEPLYTEHSGIRETFITKQDRYIQPYSARGYHYFTQKDQSQHGNTSAEGGMVYFSGQDVIYGSVRSNSNIWVKQAGGGTNNGWPTFFGPVYTSGLIQSISGAVPYEQVFRNIVYENCDSLSNDEEAIAYQMTHNSTHVLGAQGGSNKICYMSVNGSAYTTWIGNIVENGIDSIDVYASYPPPTGAPLFWYNIPHTDTVWTVGPSGSINQEGILYIDAPLWIKGTFSGKWTIYSPYTIWINDDITLSGTQVGLNPDGGINPFSSNPNDVVNLVTEKQIQIQYGYRDPADSLRKKPNCSATGIYVYANLFALNKSTDNAAQHDGMFSFEYQHPHPSTPDMRIGTTVYDKIDLHLRHFPQTLIEPWPGGLDYPWYNPLWPESMPSLERGTVHLYGSVYQYRRGFMHRSLNDPYDSGTQWILDNHMYGGQSVGQNIPGTTGAGVGYQKDYNYDHRPMANLQSYNPFGFGMRLKTSTNGTDWQFQNYMSMGENFVSKSYDIAGDLRLYHLNRHLYTTTGDNFNLNEVTTLQPSDWKIKSAMLKNNGDILSCWYSADFDSLRLVQYTNQTNSESTVLELPLTTRTFSLIKDEDHTPYFVNLDQNGQFGIYAPNQAGNWEQTYTWNPVFAPMELSAIIDHETKLTAIRTSDDSLFVCFWMNYMEMNQNRYLFKSATGYLPSVDSHDPIAIPIIFSSKCYPNPFSNELNLTINTGKASNATISIYNVRGQCVKNIPSAVLKKGTNHIAWDGKNSTNQKVSQGVYLVRIQIEEKIATHKILMMR